jgi:hypothetical protein
MISNSPHAREEGLAAGVDKYLEKGAAIESLPVILNTLLLQRVHP